jgi:HAMP domain-containing protein
MSVRFSLGHVGISAKVVFSGLTITALFLVTAFVWVLPHVEDALVARKKDKIKEQTETVWGVLDYYHDQANRGILKPAEARSLAAAVIDRLRFGPTMKDYFWVIDLNGTTIVQPYRSDLIGVPISAPSASASAPFIQKFIAVAQKQGEGYVEYRWQWQDDPTRTVPKISFVRLFRPWGWIIGTGMYVEDVKEEVHRWKASLMIVFLGLGFVGAILSSLIGQAVARSVADAARKGENVHERLEEDLGLRRETSLRLRAFILFMTVPVLIAITTIWCAGFYHDLHRIIMEGFDAKLSSVTTATGAFIGGEDHVRIEREGKEDDLYRAYTRPMREIIRKADVTYLYSQVLPEEGTACRYVLDASEGDDHTTLGTEEPMTDADYRGARNVLTHGIVHIGQVIPTDNWGLLKSAYAPIYTRGGDIVGMAGADVNIDMIRKKTHAALFLVSLVGVAAMLLGVWLSLVIARRLTEPLDELREGALKLASGSFDHRITIAHPVELSRLSADFNRIGQNLGETFRELIGLQTDLEANARRSELITKIDRAASGAQSSLARNCAVCFCNNKAGQKSASGYWRWDKGTVLWLAHPGTDGLEAVRLRSDLRLTLGRLLAHAGEAEKVVARVREMYNEELRAVFLHLPKERRLDAFCRGRVEAVLLHSASPASAQEIAGDVSLNLAPGTLLLVSDHDQLAALMSTATAGVAGFHGETPLLDALGAAESAIECSSCDRQIMIGIFGTEEEER